MSAKDNGGIRSYGASVCFDKEADFDPACLARSAVDRVLAHLNPTDVVPQKMSVVLKPPVCRVFGSDCGYFRRI